MIVNVRHSTSNLHSLFVAAFFCSSCISLPQRSQSKADMSSFWMTPCAGPGENADNTDDLTTATPRKRCNLESHPKTMNMSGKKTKVKGVNLKDANESSSGLGAKRPMQSLPAKRQHGQTGKRSRPATPWNEFVANYFASAPPGSFQCKMNHVSKLWAAKKGTTCEEEDATDTRAGSVPRLGVEYPQTQTESFFGK